MSEATATERDLAHPGDVEAGTDGAGSDELTGAAEPPEPSEPTSRIAVLVERLRSVHPAAWTVALLVAAYTVYFTDLTLDIHHGLGTASYDSALYDQGVWLLSRFEEPFVTLMGRNLLGDHTSFILLVLVPLYWIAPGAWILFGSQALAIGAGAIPVYLVARSRLNSPWFGAMFAAVYLLHPAVSWTNMENFHPDAYLGVLVGFAIYGALEERWRVYAVFVALALLVKEDVSLVVVPLGAWVAWKRNPRYGVLTILASVAFMLVAMFVVMRSLIGVPTRNTWRIPFGGPAGLIETAVRNPTQIADHFRSEGRPWYLWQMLSPTAFLWVRRWDVAAISALVLFTNVLSTWWYQFHIQYHYSLIAVPALVIGTAVALGEAPESGRWNRRRSATAVGVCAVLAAYAWAPLPGAHHEHAYWAPDHPSAVAAREIITGIPDDASVAAHHAITPHLAYRSEIYEFPNPFRVRLYGTDIAMENTRLDTRADRVDLLVLQRVKSAETEVDFTRIRAAFVLERSNEFWEVWRRDPDVPLPPLELQGG
ncbi:MAG: DUF2079 domain-containing protein [Ilumatobacter sp.]|nr:DUF2079 domain-containing protein [Ilumatobacter sp.]